MGSSSFADVSLGDIVDFRNGKAISPEKYRTDGKHPVYGSNGQIAFSDEVLYPDPTIVIGRVGAYCGCVHYVPNASWVTDNAIVALPQEGHDIRYLYYLLGSLELERTAIGSAQPLMTQKGLNVVQTKVPTLAEQKAIAHILGSLDDKIELNRKMNATLEGMAQALFKSWFVDFDPVLDNAIRANNPIPEEFAERAAMRKAILAQNQSDDLGMMSDELNSEFKTHHSAFPSKFTWTESMGWIPEGWAAATLGEYLEIKRGGSPRPIHDFLCSEGLPWVKIADATASPSRFLFSTKEYIRPEGLKKTVLMKKGSLILSNSATPGLPIFLELDACIHDGWLHFPKKKHFCNLYLYQLFLVIREELVAQGNGSVFTNLKTDILRAQRIVVPPTSLLQIFEDWMMPNFEKIRSVNVGARSLSEFRDTLLPKLISGEVRIPEAENLTQETLT